MTVAVVVLAIVVAILSVLVAGLLRSHALILRRLHEAGLGLDDAFGGAPGPTLPLAGGSGTTEVAEDLRTPRPTDAPLGRPAADVAGTRPDGGAVGVAVAGVDHDTVLLFLSSDCLTCQRFWSVLGDAAAGPRLPEGVRLVVVTRGAEHESPAAIAEHGAQVPVVMSDAAWHDHEVPGSPYAIHVDGPSGRILGEGTGGDWAQVAQLLARATGDLAYVEDTPRSPKARRDTVAEQDTDAALLAAGILPGDDSLYRRADGTWAGLPEGSA